MKKLCQGLGKRLPEEQKSAKGFLKAALLPVHTYMFGGYFLLFEFNLFHAVSKAQELILAALVLFIIIFLFRCVLLAAMGKVVESALIATLWGGAFLFFITFSDLLYLYFYNYKYLLWIAWFPYKYIFLCLILGTGTWWILTKRKASSRLSQAIDIACVMLVLLAAGKLVLHPPAKTLTSFAFKEMAVPKAPEDQRRDIFFILMDSHTSIESLKRYWNYQDTHFADELQRLGFTVLPDAHSTYPATVWSMSEFLNMDYPLLPDNLGMEQTASLLIQSIREGRLLNILKQNGYQITNLSPFPLGDIPEFYDLFDSNFYNNLFKRTLAGYAWDKIHSRFYMKRVHLEILNRLREFPMKSESGAPRFVYAHLFLPHAPYVFDRNGNFKKWPGAGKNEKSDYLDQLIYTDKAVLQAIQAILSNASRPPVIVLQADHGFRHLHGPEANYEAHTIFSAYLLPDGGDKELFPGIRPVNAFRVVLNHYFNAGLPYETNKPPQSHGFYLE